MREYTIMFEEGLKVGLRKSDHNPKNKGALIEAQGVIQKAGELHSLEELEFLDVSTIDACTFPFPQIFQLTSWTLVCTPTKIYTFDGAAFTLVYTAAEGSTWTVAEFHDFLLLTNGAEWVTLDPDSGCWEDYIPDEIIICLCNCDINGQLFVGGPGVSIGAGWLGE